MEENTSPSPDITSKVSEQKPEPVQPKVPSANTLAARSRADIYSRFDKQQEQDTTGSSPEKEESKPEKDLKEESEPEPSSVSEEKPKKPDFEKKGKEIKVPLQALHESRDRFKKLNLEYREYRESTDSRVKELQEQVKALSSKLSSNNSLESEESYDLGSGKTEEPELQKLRKKIQELEQRTSTFDKEQQLKTIQEQEAQRQKLVDETDKELAESGYPGFKAVLFEVGNRLVELVKEGEITEAESRDPNVWKRVYIEDKFPSIKQLFVTTEKAAIKKEKIDRKKEANLVSAPGLKDQGSPEEDEGEEKDLSFDDFNRKQINELLSLQKKKFYARQKKK